MRFAFSAEQLLFRDTIAELLAKECPPAELRACWARGDGRVPSVWSSLADLGVLGLLVPEADGGMGADELDLVLLLEETGRAGLPDPIVETALVAPALLGALDAGDRADWPARIAAGAATVALAPAGSDLAVGAAHADLLVVLGQGRILGLPRAAFTVEPQRSVDGARAVAVVSHTNDPVPWATGDVAGQITAAAFDRAAMGTAAQLIGLGDRMLAMTADYVVDRHQFGVPIGSFQAIKHHLADALLHLEFARPAVYRAAHSIATASPDRSRDVSMAKALAADAASLVARTALQCHGAIGYTVEHDLHLFMKRTWALARAWGDASWHRARVADLLLGAGPSL